MLTNILEKFKNPITLILEKAEEEEGIKKSLIKLLIISAVLCIGILGMIIYDDISIYSNSYYEKNYTSSELWEMRLEQIKERDIFSILFKSWIMMLIAIASFALILYIIAKLVKCPIEYSKVLTLLNSILIMYIIGFILNLIISLIYKPLGWLVIYSTTIYVTTTFMYAYRDMLNIDNNNKLVLATTGVFTVAIILVVIILSALNGVPLGELLEMA